MCGENGNPKIEVIGMSNEVKLSDDQMIFSIEELKKAGFLHYKINQMVEDGTLLKLNKRFYENTKY